MTLFCTLVTLNLRIQGHTYMIPLFGGTGNKVTTICAVVTFNIMIKGDTQHSTTETVIICVSIAQMIVNF